MRVRVEGPAVVCHHDEVSDLPTPPGCHPSPAAAGGGSALRRYGRKGVPSRPKSSARDDNSVRESALRSPRPTFGRTGHNILDCALAGAPGLLIFRPTANSYT